MRFTSDRVGERLDVFLVRQMPALSRSYAQRLIAGGNVAVDGERRKANFKLSGEEMVVCTLPPAEETEICAEDIQLDILYEDADIIVINKRRGMVVHPAAGVHTGTLVNALLHHCSDLSGINGALRPGIVHRLDKDTSGVLITARTAAAEAFLKNEFKMRRTEKYYVTILNGVPKEPSGVIETSVFRSRHTRIRFAASADLSKGKYARSRYRVLKVYGQYSLVLFKIDTGRTHQIRLHARFIGCPVAGDTLYGKKNAVWKQYGLMLHAYRLRIRLPAAQEKTVFTAPPPHTFLAALHMLRSRNKH